MPLHDHWNIAGHKTKQDSFALLESRQEEGFDYLGSTLNRSDGKPGRKRQARFLTVAALERFCLAAHTREGDAIRELYRQAKAKWDIVQQIAPSVAAEAELMSMKIELAKIEAQKETAIVLAKTLFSMFHSDISNDISCNSCRSVIRHPTVKSHIVACYWYVA